MSGILLCAMLFSSPQHIPSTLETAYRRAFHCPAAAEAPQAPPIDRLERINLYFPDETKVWPVLPGNTAESQLLITAYGRRGIRPALLLPAITDTLAGDLSLLAQLRQARRAGGLPVVALANANPEDQELALKFWCSFSLCPAAWYLPQGVGLDIVRLLPGVYLSAPHWYGHPQWPLPDREMDRAGRRILPLHERIPESGGTVAVIAAPPDAALYAPQLQPLHWTWGIIDYQSGGDGLQADSTGWLQLQVRALSLQLWSGVRSSRISLLASASDGFAWVSIGLIALNLAFYFGLVFERLRPSRRTGPAP
jgi:hypothetical protein